MNKRIFVIGTIGVVALSMFFASFNKQFLLNVLFSCIIVSSFLYVLLYLSMNLSKKIVKTYVLIVAASIFAMIPMLLTGFYYGDDLSMVSYETRTVEPVGIAMRRPLFSILAGLFSMKTAETSNIFRCFNVFFLIVFALLLYRLVYNETRNNAWALAMGLFSSVSIIAVDCIAYLSIFPTIYALLFSIIAFLELDQGILLLKEKKYGMGTGGVLIFALTLWGAFCMYQIITPVFFLFMVITLMFENNKQRLYGKTAVYGIGYCIVALIYFISTKLIQIFYNVANIQSARSEFISSISELLTKLYWFVTTVLPQTIVRIFSAIIPAKQLEANNRFYTIVLQNSSLEFFLELFIVVVICIELYFFLRKKEYFKLLGIICAIPLSFYPFIILPESVILTYYLLPLVLLLAFLFFGGCKEIGVLLQRCIRKQTVVRARVVKTGLLIGLVMMLLVSVNYSNYWVTYNRDSYQYIKQCLGGGLNESVDRIHVYGIKSEYVGGNPYIVFTVYRALEELEMDSNKYQITQTDNDYSIGQLTSDDVAKLSDALETEDYEWFMNLYVYSKEYDTYYLEKPITEETNKNHSRSCLKAAHLLPEEADLKTLIINLNGFNATHKF